MKNFFKIKCLGCAPYKKNAVNKLSQNNNGHERERAENSIKKIQ